MRRLIILAAALVVLAVVAVVAVVVIEKARSDDPDLRTSAPEIPTAIAGADVPATLRPTGATAPAATPSATSAPATTPATPATSSAVVHFVIDSTQSSAKYVVSEKLSRLPVESDAVGTTSDVTGDIFLTPSGLASGTKSSFKVDLRTLKTDEGLRDRFVRDNTLQTSRFPFAEYEITSITGFPANYTDNTEVPVTITGNMTIHGMTKPMTFTSKARRAGPALTGIADVDFKMSDFGISPPSVPIAKAHDEIHVQVVIVAKQA